MTEEDIQARMAAAIAPLVEQTAEANRQAAESNRLAAEADARTEKREQAHDARQEETRELQRRSVAASESMATSWARIAGALEARNVFPYGFSVQPVDCQHEYPSPWFGTVPAPCKKCGRTP